MRCCPAGDRYLLKLFRDFVFHQSREDGSPVLDWGHVVECLNKLDAGLPEKVRSAQRLTPTAALSSPRTRKCTPLFHLHQPNFYV